METKKIRELLKIIVAIMFMNKQMTKIRRSG